MSMATRDAYGRTLVELGAEYSQIVVLDADLSRSTKTGEFFDTYPERSFNIGIAEANMMGIAAGFATCNKIPFVSTFAIFGTLRAADQVRNSICYPNLNVKIALTHAGITVGEDGASHQVIEDMSLMRAMPNMTVIAPADGEETSQAVRAAAEYVGPVYLRLGRPKVPRIFDSSYKFEIGKGVIVHPGDDATVIACGIMLSLAIEAAKELAEEGISVRVINMPTIKPIDREIIIAAARETKGIVTAEEHSIIGGLGGAVAEVVSESAPTLVKRVGMMDTFGESGKPDELMQKYGLTKENIISKIREIV